MRTKITLCKTFPTSSNSRWPVFWRMPSTWAWYTTEQFLEKFGRIMNGQEKFLLQVQILDLNEGIKAGFQRMHDLHIKVEDFAAKVAAYYRSKG